MAENDRFAEGYAVGRDSNDGCYNNQGGMGFGGEWGGLIGLLIVASLFGNGGFGFGGGGRGSCATQADLAAGFNNSAVLSSLNDIKLNQSSAINYNNQGFAGLNTALLQGFHGIDNAICTLGYHQAQGINSLSHQFSDCCCQTQRAIDSVRFDMSKGFCDIIRAGQDNTNAIIGWLTQEKIASLQAENSGLKAQISNDKQSAYIVSQLREPCPVPSYIVPNPNCCYNYGVTGVGYGTGYNNGCGCG